MGAEIHTRLLMPLRDATHRKERACVIHFGVGIIVVFVGFLGVLSDSWLRKAAATWVDIHALFGLLLCALVIERFRWRLKYRKPVRPADTRALTRHLSRIVYLALYLVIGVRQVTGIVDSLSHGGDLGLGRIDTSACAWIGCASLGPTQDFQSILAYGLATLILIRALVFSISLPVPDNIPDAQLPLPPSLHDSQ